MLSPRPRPVREGRPFAIVLLLAAVAITAANVPYSIKVRFPDHPVTYDLGNAPLWDPPPYEAFAERLRIDVREDYARRRSLDMNAAIYADDLAIEWLGVAFIAVVALWPAALLSGLVYLSTRRQRRDPFLQWLLGIGVALTLAATTSVSLWILYGGWGPPLVPELMLLALVGGTISARRSLRRHANAAQSAPQDPRGPSRQEAAG